MKTLPTLIFVSTLVLSSCCKSLVSPHFTISVPSLTETTDILIFSVEKDNHASAADTLYMGDLDSVNNYTVHLTVPHNLDYDIIIQVDSGLFSDTITDLHYELSGSNCSLTLKDFEYKLNGELKTDPEIVIE